MVVVMIWLERRVVALMQGRLGPNRVGFQGVLQPVADAVKLFFRENIMQRQADSFLFNISPVLVMFSSLLAFCFVPLGEPVRIGGTTITLWIAESPEEKDPAMVLSRHTRPFGPEDAAARVKREYAALPGLRLTPAQVHRIWALDDAEARWLLGQLVEAGFLVEVADGVFMRRDVAPGPVESPDESLRAV